MTVDIKFYDTFGNQLSLDKVTGGIDFATARKGQPYVIPVVVKNLGTSDATGLSVKGSPLNASNEVTTEEYNNQVLASSWKTFSLLPTSGFAPTLTLPNIPAGKTMVGVQQLTELFTNPQSSAWKNDTLAGHIFSWTGSSLSCSDVTTGSTGKYFARADAVGWGNNLNTDVTFKHYFPSTPTTGSAFTMFGFRMNCLGDQKGYIVNIKRSATNMFAEIRKCAGVLTSGATDFGTILATSNIVPWVDYQLTRIKVWTNTNGYPELKMWVGNVGDTDTPLLWGTSPNQTQSWVDIAKTYPYAGGICAVFGMGSSSTATPPVAHIINYASLTTDDPNGKIYIRTIIGDGAVDSKIYNSSMEFFYDPPIV